MPPNVRFPQHFRRCAWSINENIADIPRGLYSITAMTASVSRSVYHHGKRHRLVVTAKDDSLEAFEAALGELRQMF
jgi:hypothetical protein